MMDTKPRSDSIIELSNDLHAWLDYAGGAKPNFLHLSTIGRCGIPVITFSFAEDIQDFQDSSDLVISHFMRFGDHRTGDLLYRCSGFDRLDVVKLTGIDVSPSTQTIYAADRAKKALEYARHRVGVVCAYDSRMLLPTWFEIKQEDDAVLDHRYPLQTLRTGRSYRYRDSIVDVGNYYAKWVPGDPWDALKAVFVIGNTQ